MKLTHVDRNAQCGDNNTIGSVISRLSSRNIVAAHAYLPCLTLFWSQDVLPEALSWACACMRGASEVLSIKALLGGRRLRMDARLPVLRLIIELGTSPRLASCLSESDVRVQASRADTMYPQNDNNEGEAQGRGW